MFEVKIQKVCGEWVITVIGPQWDERPWIAFIRGLDPKYRFRREFTGTRRPKKHGVTEQVWLDLHRTPVGTIIECGSGKQRRYFRKEEEELVALTADEVEAEFRAQLCPENVRLTNEGTLMN